MRNDERRTGRRTYGGWRLGAGAAAVAAALSGIAGCRGGDGGGSGNPVRAVAQTLRATDLQGRWQSDCVRASKLWGYEKKRIELAGDAVTMVSTAYPPTDSNCQSPVAELEEKGAFETGGSSPGGNNVQFQLQRVTLKAMGAAGVTFLNGLNVCGINDWREGDPRDITQATQQERVNCWDKTPRTLYDVYTIEGTRLFLGRGDARDKDAAEKRPTQIDRNMPFNKL